MGCLGYNQEELLDRKNLSQLGKILNHSDDQIMKHLTKMDIYIVKMLNKVRNILTLLYHLWNFFTLII